MNLQHVRDFVSKFGLPAAVQDMAYRAANKVTEVLILKGVSLTMDTVDPKFLEEDGGCTWGFLDRSTLRRALVQGAAADMDAFFIDEALAKGDRCYGALSGDTVASYGWYSTQPTRVTDDLMLHFDSSYAYMYKGYTLPAYRGKRLHGLGMARALRAYSEEGKKGLVSYVVSTNFSSLRSCYRMGYRDVGQMLCVRLGERHFTYATKGCEDYGLRVEPVKQ